MSRQFTWPKDGQEHWYAGPNPYFNPKECGLEIVTSLEDDEPWQFDIVLVVRDVETGDLYVTHDVGCSCPTPFEGIHGLDDMDRLTSVEQFREFVDGVRCEYPQRDVQDAE